MSPLTPFQAQGTGAMATLERDVLQYWFASLGAAHQTYSNSLTRSEEKRQTTTVPAERCPHPDRCCFSGCKRDCQSPLPAA